MLLGGKNVPSHTGVCNIFRIHTDSGAAVCMFLEALLIVSYDKYTCIHDATIQKIATKAIRVGAMDGLLGVESHKRKHRLRNIGGFL